ncbi:MerR family DNA-binding protein [Streptomyces sp. NPDC001617]
MFAYADSCAANHEVGARRVAELDERIEALTRMRDTLVRRMPWPAAAPVAS